MLLLSLAAWSNLGASIREHLVKGSCFRFRVIQHVIVLSFLQRTQMLGSTCRDLACI